MVRKNMKNFMNEYNEDGYFIQKNFFGKDFINSLLKDIESAKKLEDVDVYSDRSGLLRRLERLYDKGKINQLNIKIIEFLKKTFNKSFLIFKDKFNSKPPGGKVTKLILMVSLNFLMKIIKKKMVGMNTVIFS